MTKKNPQQREGQKYIQYSLSLD